MIFLNIVYPQQLAIGDDYIEDVTIDPKCVHVSALIFAIEVANFTKIKTSDEILPYGSYSAYTKDSDHVWFGPLCYVMTDNVDI